jgi:hypothetical protein
MLRTAETAKGTTLQGLGEHVCQHVTSGAILDSDLFQLNPISNKEISNVDVPRPAPTGASPILLQEHGTLMLLENFFLLHAIPLRFQKVSSP